VACRRRLSKNEDGLYTSAKLIITSPSMLTHRRLLVKHGNNIREYRRRLYLRSTELSWIVGRRDVAVSKWEHSHITPRLESALALSACPVEILFLEQFKAIRSEVRHRMANLPAKRYPDVRSCPMRGLSRCPKIRKPSVRPTAW
jgi:ribosome-binding protein aMBF1 (putative translation factor)